MKTFALGGVLLAASVWAAPAMAQDGGEWSANIAFSSEYVWRGVTQSQGDFAVSGGFDYANGLFYAGTWASNVDFGDATDTNVEVDLYGGIASTFGNGVTWDVGIIGYLYPDSSDSDLDFVEIYGGLGYEFASGFGIGGYVYVDPDNENYYFDATAAYGFSEFFSADVSVGYYDFEGGGDYTNGSVGGTFAFEGFELDLRYWATDIETAGLPDPFSNLLEDRFVASIGRSF